MLITVAIVLTENRMEDAWGTFFLFALAAAGATAFLYLGMQARPEGGAPPAFQSTLLVAGLLLAIVSLFLLADLLGAEDTGSAGTLTWVLLAFGVLALWPGVRRRSAICTAIAAVSFAIALLAAWQWLFDPDSTTPFRWLLLLIAITYVVVSLTLRGSSHRHSELLVSVAGLAVLAIGMLSAVGFFIPFATTEELSGFWELVLVVAGCGLLAYAAADKVPGPAYVGGAVLLAFVLLATGDDATLLWWPLLLGLLGLAAVVAGVRPSRPLPPQPDPYGASDLPLAARSDADETVIRVRDES